MTQIGEIADRLEEWRSAERRLAILPPGTSEAEAAEDEVRRAQTAYRAQFAQAAAYWSEVDFAANNRASVRWPMSVDRAVALNE